LFSTDPAFIHQAVAAGVDGITVDWERNGKPVRQAGADTQINADTLEDLRRVRASTDAQVICRINSYGATTAAEVEQAIEAGVNELFLPMVRSVTEVEAVLAQVNGRCGVGILVETVAATRIVVVGVMRDPPARRRARSDARPGAAGRRRRRCRRPAGGTGGRGRRGRRPRSRARR
jgi:citrate lyase beta subunit